MARTAHAKAAPDISLVSDIPAPATFEEPSENYPEPVSVGGGAEMDAPPAPPARRPRGPNKNPRQPRAAKIKVPVGPKLVPAPVPVGTVPQADMPVAMSLSMIPQGSEMTIFNVTWHEVNEAADELGIREFIWTKPSKYGVDVHHRPHGDELDAE